MSPISFFEFFFLSSQRKGLFSCARPNFHSIFESEHFSNQRINRRFRGARIKSRITLSTPKHESYSPLTTRPISETSVRKVSSGQACLCTDQWKMEDGRKASGAGRARRAASSGRRRIEEAGILPTNHKQKATLRKKSTLSFSSELHAPMIQAVCPRKWATEGFE